MDTSRVLLYTPGDVFIGELPKESVTRRERVEELNGEHSLTIDTEVVLKRETRVLTCDDTGKWREYVVVGEDAEHSGGAKPIGTYYCNWSVQHDLELTVVYGMPGTENPVTAAVALAAALAGTTRWAVGTVTNTSVGGASMWFKSGWEALGILTSVWGGEVDASIAVDSEGVISRSVDLFAMQGDQNAKRRFDWSRDMTSVRRKVDEAPMACRIIPRGQGFETEEGGYGRKITIEEVNDGKNYLQNDAVVEYMRLPGTNGWEYPTLVVENGDIDNAADLKAWGLSVLPYYTEPRVTYQADVVQLSQAGMDTQGIALGDAVQCVDRGFCDEGLRVTGRVMRIVANELDPTDNMVTIGHLKEGLAGWFSEFAMVDAAVREMNGGSLKPSSDIEMLLERLNVAINSTGGYAYLTEGHGILCYDVAVTDPLVGAEASKVVEIKGGTIRIADSKTAQGQWNWRTVFVSGLVASEVLSASNITTGALRVEDANHNAVFVADMDAGTVQMAGDAITIGQRTLGDAVNVVYGTFYREMHYDETRQSWILDNYGGDTPQFVWTDETILKLKWKDETNNWPGGSNWWFKLNGTRAAQNYGGRLQIPEGFRVERNQLIVLEVERYDESDQTKWRWLATGVESAAQSTDLSDRGRFARDTSSIEINGGKVTFNAGTFEVNADNFTVDEDGVITATAGTIGGMTIAQNHIYNDSLDLYGQGLDFLYDGDVFGSIQPQYLVDQQGNIYGLINQRVPGAYRFMSKVPNASGSPDLVYEYSREHEEIIGSDTYTNVKGGFNMFGDISMVGDEFFKGKVFFGNTRVDDIFDYGLSTNVYVTYNGHNYLLVFANGLLTTYTRIS